MRTAYGPFQLGALKRGKIEEVNGKTLKEQLGKHWAGRVDAHRRRPT